MKSFAIVLGVLLVVLVGLFYWFNNFIYEEKQGTGVDNAQLQSYTLGNTGLSFSYRAGSGGYTLVTASDELTDSRMVAGVIMMEHADSGAFKGQEGREAPPSLSVRAYENFERLDPGAWVAANPELSGVARALGTPVETVVGGASAVRYPVDGLYRAETVVVAYGGFIMVFVGEYLDSESPLRRDFESLLESAVFAPPLASEEVRRAACEGALAFMTFSNGEAADQFLAACLRGEHPDVVIQYQTSHSP